MRLFRAVIACFILMLTSLPLASSADDLTCPPPPVPKSSPRAQSTPAFTAQFPAEGGHLHVMAAASLTDAFGEIAMTLEHSHPGLTVDIETAGSQTLVTQLDEGARADVLATANTTWMTKANEKGLLAGPSTPFTGNRLVIVTPPDNPAHVNSVTDLANADVVLANADVPAGSYAINALCQYDQLHPGENLVDAVSKRVVSREPDVRHVLTRVQLGEADAGIVYASDATASARAGQKLNVIEFPDELDVRATYPIAPVAGGNADLANAFIAYVLSPDGQAILQKYGFS